MDGVIESSEQVIGRSAAEFSDDSDDPSEDDEHDEDCDNFGTCELCCAIDACTTKDGRANKDVEFGAGCGIRCEFCDATPSVEGGAPAGKKSNLIYCRRGEDEDWYDPLASGFYGNGMDLHIVVGNNKKIWSRQYLPKGSVPSFWAKYVCADPGHTNYGEVSDENYHTVVYGHCTVRTIKYACWRFNENIVAVYFPATLQKIGDEAFRECSNLKTVIFDTCYSQLAWDQNVMISKMNCLEIGSLAFAGCPIGAVDITRHGVFIGSKAFYKCEQLFSVSIHTTFAADAIRASEKTEVEQLLLMIDKARLLRTRTEFYEDYVLSDTNMDIRDSCWNKFDEHGITTIKDLVKVDDARMKTMNIHAHDIVRINQVIIQRKEAAGGAEVYDEENQLGDDLSDSEGFESREDRLDLAMAETSIAKPVGRRSGLIGQSRTNPTDHFEVGPKAAEAGHLNGAATSKGFSAFANEKADLARISTEVRVMHRKQIRAENVCRFESTQIIKTLAELRETVGTIGHYALLAWQEKERSAGMISQINRLHPKLKLTPGDDVFAAIDARREAEHKMVEVKLQAIQVDWQGQIAQLRMRALELRDIIINAEGSADASVCIQWPDESDLDVCLLSVSKYLVARWTVGIQAVYDGSSQPWGAERWNFSVSPDNEPTEPEDLRTEDDSYQDWLKPERSHIGPYGFCGCTSLGSVATNISVLQESCFQDCGKDEKVALVLEDGVVIIGKGAFCNSCLGEITLPGTLANIGKEGFARSKVTELFAAQCFDSTRSLQIGRSAFSECVNMSHVDFGTRKIEMIGSYAFNECSTLATVKIGQLAKSGTPDNFNLYLGMGSFAMCEELRDFFIPFFHELSGRNILLDSPQATIHFGRSNIFNIVTSESWANKHKRTAEVETPIGDHGSCVFLYEWPAVDTLSRDVSGFHVTYRGDDGPSGSPPVVRRTPIPHIGDIYGDRSRGPFGDYPREVPEEPANRFYDTHYYATGRFKIGRLISTTSLTSDLLVTNPQNTTKYMVLPIDSVDDLVEGPERKVERVYNSSPIRVGASYPKVDKAFVFNFRGIIGNDLTLRDVLLAELKGYNTTDAEKQDATVSLSTDQFTKASGRKLVGENAERKKSVIKGLEVVPSFTTKVRVKHVGEYGVEPVVYEVHPLITETVADLKSIIYKNHKFPTDSQDLYRSYSSTLYHCDIVADHILLSSVLNERKKAALQTYQPQGSPLAARRAEVSVEAMDRSFDFTLVVRKPGHEKKDVHFSKRAKRSAP